ncbi:paired box and transposase domain containing [Brachionus plicatilis]|uniref:Paired box and transposase domain containing n=1 Tax=Brachionus plicatilis TaxID=10195 RepID=A0A3M7T9N8_BRAPC|nr:paired box and transposase domain containing [Brachionus plicatilis]
MSDNWSPKRLVGVLEKCVRTTRKNNDIYGTPKKSTRPWRPRKLTNRDQNSLFIQFKNVKISRETVRRFLTSKGIGTYTALKKPLLTASDRIKRLKWCNERLNWTIERWGMVIFNHESNFEVFNRKSRVLVKRLKKEKYDTRFVIPTLQGGGGSAGIWGRISSKGTGCCRIYEGRINQHNFWI